MEKVKDKSSAAASKNIMDIVRKVLPIAGFVIMFVLFACTTNGLFIRWVNLQNLLRQATITIIAAIGAGFVMAHGNLDFSLGGASALSACLAYLVAGPNLWLFFLLCIVFGVLCALCAVTLHIKGNIPVFMGGMCIMFAGRGFAQGVTPKAKMVLNAASNYNTIWFFAGVLLLVAIVGYVLFTYTKIGKYQKLMGTNMQAAILSGIDTAKFKAIAFAISGTTLGIATCLYICRSPQITGNTGLSLETNVLLGLCLGGMPMTGGSSAKIRAAIVGSLIFFMMGNGLTLWNVNADLVDIIRAIFFLGTVSISLDRSQYQTIG